MTVEYSDSAKTRVEDYLRAVRDRLKASESVDAQEVVNDLRGHIERELSGLSQPVSEADVNEVLDRLGPPEQVVDEGDMSWWRKMILRLRRGPEDWRLAYLSLGVLIVGILLAGLLQAAFSGPSVFMVERSAGHQDVIGTGGAAFSEARPLIVDLNTGHQVVVTGGGSFSGIMALGIFASFLLSRAALAVAREPDPPAKKWLIYPSLIIVYSLVAFIGLLWPAYALGGLAGELSHAHGRLLYNEPFFDSDGVGTVLAILGCGGMGLAVWWLILWLLGRRYPLLVQVLFRPFADHRTGRLFGKVVLGVWAITIVLIAITVLLWIST